MPPLAAPSPPPPPLLSFSEPAAFAVLYAIVAACIAFFLLLGLVVCAYYSGWPRNCVNRARLDCDIERLQQWAEAVAPPVVVVENHGDVRKFDIDGCPTCLEDFEEGEPCEMLETCGHGYDESCIKEWLSKHLRCPLCRGLVQVRQAARVTPAFASS